MSIASSLQQLETDITNSYNVISSKGGTIPSDKNTNNLSSAINSIPQSGGGGEDFDYDNWIAYGTSTPSASNYKYWLPIDTTSTNTPLKQVKNYTIEDCYTGDLAGIFEGKGTSTATSNSYVNNIIWDNNTYYNIVGWTNYMNSTLSSSMKIYKYVYNNQDDAIDYVTNTDNAVATIQPSTYTTGTTSGLYGGWTAKNNKVYSIYEGNYLRIYDISSGTTTSKNLSLLTSTLRICGMRVMSDGNTLIIVALDTTTSSNTKIVVYKYLISSGTKSTLYSGYSTNKNISSYRGVWINDDLFLIHESTGTQISTNSSYYTYSVSKNVVSLLTVPSVGTSYTSSNWGIIFRCIPANRVFIRFWSVRNYLFEIKQNSSGNGYFDDITSSFGNLFNGCISSFTNTHPTIIYLSADSSTFRTRIGKNDLYMNKGYNATGYAIFSADGYKYFEISDSTSANYTWGHDDLETQDSTNNVLLPATYGEQVSNALGYAFYPKSNQNIFLWLYRNNGAKFVYNKQLYTLYISKNGSWVTVDDDENIV